MQKLLCTQKKETGKKFVGIQFKMFPSNPVVRFSTVKSVQKREFNMKITGIVGGRTFRLRVESPTWIELDCVI